MTNTGHITEQYTKQQKESVAIQQDAKGLRVQNISNVDQPILQITRLPPGKSELVVNIELPHHRPRRKTYSWWIYSA